MTLVALALGTRYGRAGTRVWTREVEFVDEAGFGEHLASAHEARLAQDQVGGEQLVVDERGGAVGWEGAEEVEGRSTMRQGASRPSPVVAQSAACAAACACDHG